MFWISSHNNSIGVALVIQIFCRVFNVLLSYVILFVYLIYFLMLWSLLLFFILIFAKTIEVYRMLYILFLTFIATFRILVLYIKDAYFQNHLTFVLYTRPTWCGQYVKWICELVVFGDLYASWFQNCFCFAFPHLQLNPHLFWLNIFCIEFNM